jgi:hypothetical protein
MWRSITTEGERDENLAGAVVTAFMARERPTRSSRAKVQVFVGVNEDHFQLAGEVILDPEEVQPFCDLVNGVESEVAEEQPATDNEGGA